jgi:hypothetical protein
MRQVDDFISAQTTGKEQDPQQTRKDEDGERLPPIELRDRKRPCARRGQRIAGIFIYRWALHMRLSRDRAAKCWTVPRAGEQPRGLRII